MGTRGTYGFRKGGKDKLTYNHYDSYPDGLGAEVVQFVRDTPVQELNDIFDRLIMVEEDDTPTPEQIAECARFTDLSVSSHPTKDWYCLLRNAQGKLSALREVEQHQPSGPFPFTEGGVFLPNVPVPNALRYMIDQSEFIKDSLFCEHGYIINLDTNELEYWLGFQRHGPQKGNRYGDKKPADWTPKYSGDSYYYPCALVGRWPLAELPPDIVTQMDVIFSGHRQHCNAVLGGDWSGHPNPEDPDDEWICDNCGGIVPAKQDEEE